MPCNSTAANVVCVGASTNRDEPAGFSNVSATAVDLFAPGANVLSTGLNGGFSWASGTSMAAPHVSGVAALLAAKALFAGLSATGGRLNAAGALAALPAAQAPAPPAVRAPAAATVQSLRVLGTVTSRRPAKVAYALSADTPVTAVIRCAGARSCAFRVRVSGTARGFDLSRRQDGRLLAAGRYTLTVSTPGGSARRAGFAVR